MVIDFTVQALGREGLIFLADTFWRCIIDSICEINSGRRARSKSIIQQ